MPDDLYKLAIPNELRIAIAKIMLHEKISWNSACHQIIQLANLNSPRWKNSVHLEAKRLYDSRHMMELNKSRATIEKSAYDRGYRQGMEHVRKNENNIRLPCVDCGKLFHIPNGSEEMKHILKVLNVKDYPIVFCGCREKNLEKTS